MPRFLAAVAVLGMLGCAAQREELKDDEPAPPLDCHQQAQAAEQARPLGGRDAAAAIFAQAECEQARLVGQDAGDAPDRVTMIEKLYDEAATLAPGKFTIGAAVRRGDLYRALAGGKGGARVTKAYEAGLAAADDAGMEVRMDVEVSSWIKTACAFTRKAEAPSKHVVCKPWGGAWR
jgi:hypothetical protein